MFFRTALFVASFAALALCSASLADEKPRPTTKDRAAIDQAIKSFDEEIGAAKRVYDEVLKRAGKKLLVAYDVAIDAAMKRGGVDALDEANRLSDEKKLKAVAVEIGELPKDKTVQRFDILGEWFVKANLSDQTFTFINGPERTTVYRVYVGPDFPKGVKQGPWVIRRVSPNIIEVDIKVPSGNRIERFTFVDQNTFLCEDRTESGKIVYGSVGRRVPNAAERN